MRVRSSRAGLIWLLGLCSLYVSEVAAQDEAGQQRARAPAMSSGSEPQEGMVDDRPSRPVTRGRMVDAAGPRGAPKAQPARYFFDDFSSPFVERRNWEAALGVTLTRDLLDRGQPVAAVRLAADQRVADRQPELRSVAIMLAGLPGAELSYAVQHHGAEAGERLAVEYLSADGQWYTLERVVADGRDSTGFSWHMRVLPEDALHVAFRVRFRPEVDDRDDAWYLGEVSVVGFEPLYTLAVRLRPARQARVQVVAAGGSEPLDGTAPFTRELRAGTRVHLAAPPAVDQRIFSHWSVDGVPVVDRQRVLTLPMNKATKVVANYRPWVAGRSAVSVAVVSVPEPGVRIALGPEAGRLYTHVVAEAEYPCLSGEWLALLAPPRTERLAFLGWVVNGQAQPTGESLLEHRVAGDDVLLAEYVLLGDMNGDGELDKFDVDEFVAALIDPAGYEQRYPDLDRIRRGDTNGDGVFDALDVESFVDLLLND